MASADALLARVERYYDTVPRATARVEEHGPLTLFVAARGRPYYARPRLDGGGDVHAADVGAVLARQRDLDVPEALEWVEEVSPALADAAAGAGLVVHRHPLLVLRSALEAAPVAGVAIRMIDAEDPASRRRWQRSSSGSPPLELTSVRPARPNATLRSQTATVRRTRSCDR